MEGCDQNKDVDDADREKVDTYTTSTNQINGTPKKDEAHYVGHAPPFFLSGSSSRRLSYGEKKRPAEADGGLVWRPHQYLPKSMLRKVQVMYYLARNSGRLQHPHYIELTLPPNHPLRLKHVLDRLVALRGSGMPSQYSWSCKRSYKAGYVWFDLGPNDILIYSNTNFS